MGTLPPLDLVRQSHLSLDNRSKARMEVRAGRAASLLRSPRLRTWQKLTAPQRWPAPPAWCWGGSEWKIKAAGRRDKMSFDWTWVINMKGWGRECVREVGSHAGVIKRCGEEFLFGNFFWIFFHLGESLLLNWIIHWQVDRLMIIPCVYP